MGCLIFIFLIVNCRFAAYYDRRVALYGAARRHVIAHHRARAYGHVVAYGDVAEHRRAGKDLHVVADCGTAVTPVAEGDEVQAVEVAAYAVGVEVRGVSMLEVASGADVRAGDVQRRVAGHQPLDEHRAVFAQTIVEQVAEHLLPGAYLDERRHRTAPLAIPLKVGVNGLLETQIP